MDALRTGTVNLSAAAAMVVALTESPALLSREAAGAINVWETLTGLTGPVALDFARSLAAGNQRASLIPF